MPYDIVAANSRATQVGAAFGQAMFNNSLRMQQLQSEQAMQRLQQQQAAEMLSWTIRQHHEAIDQEAQNAKNTASFMATITPTINMPVMSAPDGTPVSKPVPNPAYDPDMGAAYIKTFLPGAKDPAKVIATGGALTYHQAQAKEQEALAAKNLEASQPFIPRTLPVQINGKPSTLIEKSRGHWAEAKDTGTKPLSSIGKMQADRELAIQNGDMESAAEIDAAIAKQHATVASDVQKMVDEHKKQTGRDFTLDEVDKLYRIKMGLEPKAAVVQPVTFEQFANKHLNEFMDSKRHFDAKTKKLRRPGTVAEAMADMKETYDAMQDHIKGMPTVVTPEPVAAGAGEEKVFIVDPQGRKFKVPRRQLEDALKQGYKEYEG